MASLHRVDDERSAIRLADLLNGSSPRRPVVVVTTSAARQELWIDAEEILREAGDLADVYVMTAGPQTWEFSHRMPEGTQVYGGAGRVYPLGHAWCTDLTRSPLHFAFSVADGQRVTQSLVSDALRMATAGRLLQQAPTHSLRRVQGTVKGVVAGRAMVDVRAAWPAIVAEELTAPDVPIEAILVTGQRVVGVYDSSTGRLDVTASLRTPDEALSSYAVGDVVLTKVRDGKAELVLYPLVPNPKTTGRAVTVAVLRDDVIARGLLARAAPQLWIQPRPSEGVANLRGTWDITAHDHNEIYTGN